MNNIEMLLEKLNMENRDYDITKELIRFSLINKESSNVFSNFYNFDSDKEITRFLRDVIMPSIIFSVLAEDNGDIVVTIEEASEFLGTLDNFGFENDTLEDIKDIYRRLSKIDMVKDSKREIKKLISKINLTFSFANFIVVAVEYAKDTKDYLNNMYAEYKALDEIDILEKELLRINLCMDGFADIRENIENYKDEIKDKLLDKLPY